MIIRDLIERMDREVVYRRYAEIFSTPVVSREHFDNFADQLLQITPVSNENMHAQLVDYEGKNIYSMSVTGVGWGMYDDVTWMYMESWDIEYRPASEVLGLVIDIGKCKASLDEITLWLMEELGVYLATPRS